MSARVGPEARNVQLDGETMADEAIERLAERLHATMEHLEPTTDPEWGLLTERQKDFYRLCVRDILKTAKLLRVDLNSRSVGPTTTE